MPRLILKVTLKDVKPPVWRRIDVPAEISLAQFHGVLQVAMGWTNTHLHEFEQGRTLYGTSDREFGVYRISETSTPLSEVLSAPKARLSYHYDFGDSWYHTIVVERIVASPEVSPTAAALSPAVVIAGKGACPPEDCGGPWGYANLLDALADPSHDNHKMLTEWLGRPWDSTAVPIDAINRRLAKMRLRPCVARRARRQPVALGAVLDHTLIDFFKRRGRP